MESAREIPIVTVKRSAVSTYSPREGMTYLSCSLFSVPIKLFHEFVLDLTIISGNSVRLLGIPALLNRKERIV